MVISPYKPALRGVRLGYITKIKRLKDFKGWDLSIKVKSLMLAVYNGGVPPEPPEPSNPLLCQTIIRGRNRDSIKPNP